MITFLLQTPPPDTGFTQRPHSAPTTAPTPQRCHSSVLTPSRGAVFVQHDQRRMAFYTMAQRLHSAHLGDLQYFWTLWKRCNDVTLV